MHEDCVTESLPGLCRIYAGQQTWYSVRQKSRFSSMAATGTDALSTTSHRRLTRATGRRRCFETWSATATRIDDSEKRDGSCSDSGSTSHQTSASAGSQRPLLHAEKRAHSRPETGRTICSESGAHAPASSPSTSYPLSKSPRCSGRSTAAIARPTASATGGGKAFPT